MTVRVMWLFLSVFLYFRPIWYLYFILKKVIGWPKPDDSTIKKTTLVVVGCLFCFPFYFMNYFNNFTLKQWGSNMSANAILNLLNKLRKRDKIQGLPSILSLCCNKFNKFNNTGAWMLDSFYHMMLKWFCYLVFGVKTSRFCNICATLWKSFHNITEICKPLVVYQFYEMAYQILRRNVVW